MNRNVLSSVALVLGALALAACVTSSPAQDRGTAAYNTGNYLSANDAFSEEIRQNPDSPSAWNNRAVARVRLGDLIGAIRDYNRAIEVDPSDPELYFNRGNAFVASGLYKEAVMDYDRAIQISPTFSRAIFNRGIARALTSDPAAARQDWETAVGLEPDPYARAAMRRNAGLEPYPPVVAMAPPAGRPTTAATIAPPPAPGTLAGAPPPPAAAPAPGLASAQQPAASPLALDARALTTRAISRELDGDHAGAMRDLNAAVAIEPETARREAIIRLMRVLDAPR